MIGELLGIVTVLVVLDFLSPLADCMPESPFLFLADDIDEGKLGWGDEVEPEVDEGINDALDRLYGFLFAVDRGFIVFEADVTLFLIGEDVGLIRALEEVH